MAPDGAHAARRTEIRLGRPRHLAEPLWRHLSRQLAVRVPPQDLDLELTPRVPTQELDLTVRYWEGAVKVNGTSRSHPIAGHGFVEMTGYAPPSPRAP